jgi:REP element-mobilizing transposase RayT
MERFYRRRLPHYRIDSPGMLYFVTWRLARGQRPLSEIERNIVVDSLRYWDRVSCRLEAFVVMDDHVHLLVTLLDDTPLERLLRSWKSFTGRMLVLESDRGGPVWQHESYDHVVRNDREFEELARYIAENPQKRWPEATHYRWVSVGRTGKPERTEPAVRTVVAKRVSRN